MSAHDVDTIRTAYEEFAEHDAAAVLAELDARVEWVAAAAVTRRPACSSAGPRVGTAAQEPNNPI